MLKSYEKFLQESLKGIEFRNVFELSELQELQDVLAKSLQMSSIITTVDGEPLTEPSNFCRLCKEYVRSSELGVKQCINSDSVIGKSNADSFTVSKCLSSGLMDAGVSIIVGGKHVANWMFGQVRYEDETISSDELQQKAEQLGVDTKGFQAAYQEVPIVSKERFEYIAQLLYIISKQISELAYQSYVCRIDEQYRELLAEEMDLQKRQAEYANMVDELTQLNNRNYFEKQIERLDFLGVTPVAIVVGDVNHLKMTNDIFGHRHGDNLLSQIAEVLKEEAFDGYIICRCGGDEFNILLPNATRQEAEWYCRRVRLELKKRFDCCFMPSIAFGVGKKSHQKEHLKDKMEFADYKMYRDKMAIKEKENLVNSIHTVLLGRGFLTPEYQEAAIGMARRFGEYLKFDELFVKKLTRLVRVQDYGLVVIGMPLFEHRFQKDISIEEQREVMKHPVLSSKIARLDPNYAGIGEDALAHEENWDGSGYPNNLAGEAIPLLARLSKLIGDYNLYIAKYPIGMDKTKEEAYHMIEEGSGTLFDPEYTQKFLAFLQQDKES